MPEMYAYSNYIILKQEEPKATEPSAQTIILPVDINPSFIYGQVLSCGANCYKNITGKYVYINRISSLKLVHDGQEYYVTSDRDVVAYFA